MNLRNPFQGVWTALVTPFDPSGKIDLAGFQKLLSYQTESKITGLVPCGTTGETPTLNTNEQDQIIAESVRIGKGAGKLVMAGTGSNDTHKTIERTLRAFQLGVDAALVVTPYYNKPTQRGLFEHFTAVANQSPGPIILYNVPGRSGCSLALDTVLELAKHPKIQGIKEASGNIGFLVEMKLGLSDRPGFSILTGDDPLLVPSLSVGACGVISVARNLIPNEIASIVDLYRSGQCSESLELFLKYYKLMDDCFIETNPAPIKYLLRKKLGLNDGLRAPLVTLTSDSKAVLDQHLLRLQVLK
jgi:4-hydroxy-tetrahydrodipicolinate synthase